MTTQEQIINNLKKNVLDWMGHNHYHVAKFIINAKMADKSVEIQIQKTTTNKLSEKTQRQIIDIENL